MALRDRAVSCVSQSRPYWAPVVPATMLPEGSQARHILRQLLEHVLPGAVHPSRSRHLFAAELQHDVLRILRCFHWSRQFALASSQIQRKKGSILCVVLNEKGFIFLSHLRKSSFH